MQGWIVAGLKQPKEYGSYVVRLADSSRLTRAVFAPDFIPESDWVVPSVEQEGNIIHLEYKPVAVSMWAANTIDKGDKVSRRRTRKNGSWFNCIAEV